MYTINYVTNSDIYKIQHSGKIRRNTKKKNTSKFFFETFRSITC